MAVLSGGYNMDQTFDMNPTNHEYPNPIAFVAGAGNGLGEALVGRLLMKGWRVFAGHTNPDCSYLPKLTRRYDEERLTLVPLDVTDETSTRAAAQQVATRVSHVDMLISNEVVPSRQDVRTIRESQNYEDIHRMYNANALGPLRVVEVFLSLLEQGQMKRLCFISSELSSINRTTRTTGYSYCMSKTALNMCTKLLFNLLRPEGFTFRLCDPGCFSIVSENGKPSEPSLDPEKAAIYALAYFLRNRTGDPHQTRSDEDRLVLRDWQGRELPW